VTIETVPFVGYTNILHISFVYDVVIDMFRHALAPCSYRTWSTSAGFVPYICNGRM